VSGFTAQIGPKSRYSARRAPAAGFAAPGV